MIFLLAWRNIWRNKMRSLVIMLSVALGLFAGIAVLALYKGMMKSRVRTVIDSEIGHIQLHDPDFKKDLEPAFFINDGKKILETIQQIQKIKFVAPRSVTQGMLATATGSAGVQINGVVPQQEYQISLLKKKIIEGNLFDSSRKNEIMIGKKLAGKMKLHIGSKLVLTFTDTSATIVSGAFRVIAIYKSDNAPLDEKNVYIKMDDLNEMLGLKNNFHEIVVLLDKDEYLQEIQEKLLTLFPTIQTETWIELSPETDLLVKTTNEYSYIIMIIIMTALAFGIVNTMLMAIMERIREIGMMVALGTVRIRIFLMVLLETIFLTLAGTPIGLLIGWLVTNYFYNHGLDLSGMGKELMSSFGFGTTIYPEFPFERLPGIFIIVTMTAILSSIFPAIKALRMQPADALRK